MAHLMAKVVIDRGFLYVLLITKGGCPMITIGITLIDNNFIIPGKKYLID